MRITSGFTIINHRFSRINLRVVVWTVRSEQGDALPLGEGLRVGNSYLCTRQSMPHYPGNVYLPTPAMIATNTIVNNLINTLSL